MSMGTGIGRIAALGPDATALQLGQLVFVDCMIRARDDPDTAFLLAIHDSGTPESQKLARDVWRDGTFAEYARLPLENCIPLDEKRLCGELGYKVDELIYMDYLMVPYGGLRDIGLQPGETVVVSPATGGYGGAAVMVAVAMGARVIAMGRNEAELARLKKHVSGGSPRASIETVKMTGDETADAESLKSFGVIDAAIDFTPPQGASSSHLKSIVRAIRKGGRISLMGLNDNFVVPWLVVSKNISFKGKLMYEREDMICFAKMLERGLFPHGKDFVDTKIFSLEDWTECLDAAASHTGIGKRVVFSPKPSANNTFSE
jgi:threonine dehydrogenase-like Zn-dependent dehydrogenase